MTVRRCAVVAGAVVAALVLAACGGDDGGDDSGDTQTGAADAVQAGEGGGDFCADLEAIVAGGAEIMGAVLDEEPVTLETVVDQASELYPEMAAAVEASAPDDLAADVATMTAATTEIIEALAAADIGAPGAAQAALEGGSFTDPEVADAADRLSDHARTECGFDPDELDQDLGESAMPTSAEPPDACEFVDPQLVADAAGLPVDVADQDGGADVDLGVYATKGCSYGNGSMSISTITYGVDISAVTQSFVDSAEDNGAGWSSTTWAASRPRP